MADRLTPEQRRLNMSRVRSKDSAAELAVRRMLHAGGFRFRLHRADLPGKPDVVMPRYHAVVLINGCFWHGHDCQLFRLPTTRTDFWAAKIAANRLRDERVVEDLATLGWRVAVVWECAIRGRGRLDGGSLRKRLATFATGSVTRDTINGVLARSDKPQALTGLGETEVSQTG